MFDELIEEYRNTRAYLRKAEVPEEDKTTINSMISNLDYGIGYMSNGFPPDGDRGLHRRDIPVDPQKMERIGLSLGMFPRRDTREQRYSPEMRQHALDIYKSLTKQEQRVLWLVRVKLLSLGQAAEEMGIGKSTAQWYLDSAKGKIEDMVRYGVHVQIGLFKV